MAIQIPGFATDQQYPFWTMRKMMSSFATAGVVNLSTDFIVSPSSGLQVQATSGVAYVQQTVNIEGSSTYNGLYFCVNDATANPFNTISAPVSNPRIDQVILRVYDVQEQGLGGSSKAQIEWLQGTESASASLATMGPGLSNPGAAALPANSLRLAYVLQTVGEVTIASGNILNVAPHSVASTSVFHATATNYLAVVGDLVLCTGTGTISLPSAASSKDGLIGVVNKAGPTTVASVATIIGVGLSATSFSLNTVGAFAMLQSDGTNWFMIAGQQDTGWVALTPATSITSGGYGASSRLEGDKVWLKGTLTNGTGSTDSGTLATITTAHRPSATLSLSAAASGAAPTVNVQITTGGALADPNGLVAGAILSLDGLTYTLS